MYVFVDVSVNILQPPFAGDPFGRPPLSSSYPPPLIDNHAHRPLPVMERSAPILAVMLFVVFVDQSLRFSYT